MSFTRNQSAVLTDLMQRDNGTHLQISDADGAGVVEYVTSDTPLLYDYSGDGYYDDYGYFSAEIHEEFLGSIHQHAATFAILLSIWTFIVNIIVILACIANKENRNNGFYIQVVNLSVSNLIICVFVFPLTIYHILHAWNLDPTLCKVYIISDVLLPFASFTITILLNIDRLVSIVHPRLHSCIFQNALIPVIIFIPWYVAVVVVVPIWTSGTIPYANAPGECTVLISKEAAILCPLLTYFAPLVVLIALTFKLLLLKLQQTPSSLAAARNTGVSMKNYLNQTSEVNDENSDVIQSRSPLTSTSTANPKPRKDDIVAVCVVNTSFAAMWFPFQCISFLLSFCHAQSCIPSTDLNQVVTWIGASSAGVVPLFWFLDGQMRVGLFSLFTCTRRANRSDMPDSSNSEETFV